MEAATIALISAIAGAATTGVSLYSAVNAKKNATEAKKNAAERATIEQVQNDAKAAQERSVAQRRLLVQLSSARALSSAAGVTGGASQLVLESAYVNDARNDLATIGGNQARNAQGIAFGLANDNLRINSQTPNVGVAAFQGAMQGAGALLHVQHGLTEAFPAPQGGDVVTNQTPGVDLPPERDDASIYDPAHP